MLKYFTILAVITLSTLHAEKTCTEDMQEMFHSFYTAQKYIQTKETTEARRSYEKSISSAYNALESCQNNKDYDFNVMNNFIQASEKKLNELYE